MSFLLYENGKEDETYTGTRKWKTRQEDTRKIPFFQPRL